jgi:hypothetical protein
MKHARARYVIAFRCPHCRKMQYRECAHHGKYADYALFDCAHVCGHFGNALKYLVLPPKPIKEE